MDDSLTVKQERIDVFKDSVRFKNKKRILTVCSYHHWIVHDCGYKLSVATRDYDLRLKMMKEFHVRYNFDCYRDFWTRNPLRITDAMGGGGLYTQNDEDFSSNVIDLNCMSAEDYDLLKDDPKAFMWTKVIPVKFPQLTDLNAKEHFKKALEEYKRFQNYCRDVETMMDKEYGVIDIRKSIATNNPFEKIVGGYRGIYNTALDLRRNRKRLLEVMNANKMLPHIDGSIGSDPNRGSDVHYPMLAHNILNTKDFAEIYFPYLKELYDYAKKYDKIVYLFIQGTADRIFDFLQEAPKGHFIMHPELNDIHEFKKKLDDKVCVAGGIKTNTLYFGTVQQNIDEVKELLNEVGYDGAYFASTDKMLTFPRDAKRENLIAVNKYIANARL